MTHSSVTVIVSEATDEQDAIFKAEQKLEYYSCHRKVEPRAVGLLSFNSYYQTLKVINNFEDEGYARISFDNPDSREAEILSEELGEEIRIVDGKFTRISDYNPEARWDWYDLGGNYEGYIPSKLSAKGVNVSRKADIDFEGAEKVALAKAEVEYRKFEELTAGLVPGLTYEEILDEINPDLPEVSRKRAAGAQYREDPWVKAVCKMMGRFNLNAHEYFFIDKGGKEAFLENAANGAFSSFALLSGDDEWFETGRGYLAESSAAEWNTLFSEQIEHSEPESWFLIYEIHI